MIKFVDQSAIGFSDFFVLLLKFVDLGSYDLFIGVIFNEFLPKLCCVFDGRKEKIHILVVLGLELKKLFRTCAQRLLHFGSVCYCYVEVVVKASCSSGVPEFLKSLIFDVRFIVRDKNEGAVLLVEFDEINLSKVKDNLAVFFSSFPDLSS